MRRWSRRRFGQLTATASLVSLASPIARAQSRPKVVVIGGGAGGATAAKYLAKSGEVAVTLVEPDAQYRTCFFCNLFLGGLRSLESLLQSYELLQSRYGVTLARDHATAIDAAGRQVVLASGASLDYDRLVVAPGIALDEDALPGYDAGAMPHAWNGGPQLGELKRRLEAMDDGGLFVMVAPPNPFRCPPGPYERASMVAHFFKARKPRAKILVIDAKNGFAKQQLFQDAWASHYPGMIEWLPADFTGGVQSLDAGSLTIETAAETFKADVANVIPPQRAGRIAQDGGLADDTGWCPVDAATLESTLLPGIHVVGDAAIAGAMPKSGFAANSQAKVCAQAILTALTGAPALEPRFFNTCWSFLEADDAVAIGAGYRVEDGKITAVASFLSEREESAETRARAARQAESWYRAFTADIFG